MSAEIDGDGNVLLRWVRRSRAGWQWLDGVDAPLVEEREAYRVTLTDAGGSSRTIETDSPMLTVAAADRGAGALTVSVRQAGLYGESSAGVLIVPAAV